VYPRIAAFPLIRHTPMPNPAFLHSSLLACAWLLAAPVAAAPSAPERPWPTPDYAAVDAYFKVCVLAKDVDAAHAAIQALGGRAMTAPPEAETFALDLGGAPMTMTLGKRGMCMLAAPSVPVETLMQRLVIAHEIHHGSAFELVDASDWYIDRAPKDQRRPTLGGDPPAEAVVRRREEIRTTDGRNLRLHVLSKTRQDGEGSVFLISEAHADRAQPRPPVPPGDHSGFCRVDPAENPRGRQAHPPIYPDAALKSCAHGVVRLRLLFDAAGIVQQVAIDQSSGNTDLDAAAAASARHWTFHPACIDGQPIAGEAIYPVNFGNPCEPAQE
jgi:TonB family protein